MASSSSSAFVAVLALSALLVPAGALAQPEGLGWTLDTWTAAELTRSACRQGAGESGCDAEPLVGAGAALLVWLPSAFTVGAGVDAGAELFGATHVTFGPLAGVSLVPRPWMQIDLLAEGGVHQLTEVGDGMFRSVEGGSASLPYAGARAGWTARFGGRVRFVVGAWLVARLDLAHETLHVRTRSSGLFGDTDASSVDEETWQVGGPTFLACGRLGVEIR